jgi:4-amino-4-deoxy-L-arabinose transferase-like glycosyltransferase
MKHEEVGGRGGVIQYNRTMARSRVFVWTLLVVVFFGAIAPTLRWLEFTSGLENLNIATALELRREHPEGWTIPTLEGEMRIKKPPLATWVTATSIRPWVVEAMSSGSEAERDAAAVSVAWAARWPALLAGCLMLVAVYELGRVLGDARVGVASAVACGTCLMFLRYSRYALTDVYLGLFVVSANVFLARAIFLGERWLGMIGAGLALGLAGMSKGPVGLAQSVLPVVLFVVWRGFFRDREGLAEGQRAKPQAARGAWVLPVLAGMVIMFGVALPWVVKVVMENPEGWRVWWRDISRDDVGDRPSKWYVYLGIVAWMLPWTVWMAGGVAEAIKDAMAGRWRMLLAVFLVVVPLLVMTVVKDRKDRYMLPVIGPAAVLAGYGLVSLWAKRDRWTGLDRAGVAQHWVILGIIGVAAPVAGALFWKEAGIDLRLALAVAGGSAVAILAGIRIREQPAGMLAASVVVMLAMATLAVDAYRRTGQGQSDMRPLARMIWRTYPGAVMYNAHPRGKRVSTDLSIYLNRVTRLISMEEWAELKAGAKPFVTVTIHDKGKEVPVSPPGWKFVGRVKRDDDWWMAFVLEPRDR